MPKHNPLLRAPLKRAGLALLAVLACMAPAAAQTLNIADTLAYINEHCEGDMRPYPDQVTRTGRLSNAGPKMVMNEIRDFDEAEVSRSYVQTEFNLRLVGISTYSSGVENWKTTQVSFLCGVGVGDCIFETIRSTDYRDKSTINEKRTSEIKFLLCREPDHVVNAFRHLQKLLGGRIADPVDPFAN